MKILDNFIMIATILFMGTLVAVYSQGVEYGHICNTSKSCFSSNINDPLECSSKNETDGRCICPSDMFRHDELNRCVSPHNNTCTLQSGEGLPIRTCTEFAQCWPIEEEGPSTDADRVDGICHCDRDAKFDASTLKCKLNYGSDRCEKETQCDVRSFFTCREGQCTCQDEVHQVYNKAEGKCVMLAGGSCERVPPFLTPECAANMDCDGKICKCKDGFTETPEKTCGKGYEQDCSIESDCHPNFTCFGNEDEPSKKCMCREGQEFHQGTSKCRILADQVCGTEETADFECTFKATCEKERCVCDSGYEAGANHTCIALYGSECPSDEGIFCKEADYLTCGENSTCLCKDGYLGDDANKKCRGLIGQSCRNGNNEDCIANSICSASGTCGCGEKQVENQDKNMCLAVLGGDCGTETPCSDAHFVSCSEGVCNCKNENDQLPDQEKSRCVAKADTPCEGAAEGISCVANSTCSAEELVCRCDNSLVKDDQGMCVARQGDDSGSATVLVSGSLLAAIVIIVVIM